MQCPECDAELSTPREFCPQCGAPTSRSLREAHSTERTEPELKRSRRRVVVAGAAMLFGAAILTNAYFLNADIGLVSDAPRPGPAVIEAQQLYEEYRADFEAADARYRNREMVVSGDFVRIAPDGAGQPDLRLGTSDPAAPWGADLIAIAHEPATRLRPGQRVTVSCQRMAGSGRDRWLQNCTIEAEPEGDAAAPEGDATATKQ